MADVLRMPTPGVPVLRARGVTVRSGRRNLLAKVDLLVPEGGVFGIIGPSGAGKSTLLKVFNRLLELETPPLELTGEVLFRDRPIYDPDVDADQVRATIGMLFQQPVVFPTTVRRNVLFGVGQVERLTRPRRDERLEEALRQAALWDEVADRLDAPAVELSVGQQQRLCLARCLALRPSVLLMDEPTSALDQGSTRAIERLIEQVATRHTVVLVTHDLAQARRLADRVACVCRRNGVGRVVESGCCAELFERPQSPETIAYLESGGEP